MSGCTQDRAPDVTDEATVLYVQEGVFVIFRCPSGYHFLTDDEGIAWCDYQTGQWGPMTGICHELPTTTTETTTPPPTTTTQTTTTTLTTTTQTTTTPPQTSEPSTTPPSTTTDPASTTTSPSTTTTNEATTTTADTTTTTTTEPTTTTAPTTTTTAPTTTPLQQLGDCTAQLIPRPETGEVFFLYEGLFVIYRCTWAVSETHITWCTDQRTWDDVPICVEPTITTTEGTTTTTQASTTTPSTTTSQSTTPTSSATTASSTTTTTPKPDATAAAEEATVPVFQASTDSQSPSWTSAVVENGTGSALLPATTAIAPTFAGGGMSAAVVLTIVFVIMGIVLIAGIIGLWCCYRRKRAAARATKYDDPLVIDSDHSSSNNSDESSPPPLPGLYTYSPRVIGGKRVAIDTNRNQFVTVVEVGSGQVSHASSLVNGETRTHEAGHGKYWTDSSEESSASVYQELGLFNLGGATDIDWGGSVKGNYSRRIGGDGSMRRASVKSARETSSLKRSVEHPGNGAGNFFERNSAKENVQRGVTEPGSVTQNLFEPNGIAGDSQRRIQDPGNGTGNFFERHRAAGHVRSTSLGSIKESRHESGYIFERNNSTGLSARGSGTGSILRNRAIDARNSGRKLKRSRSAYRQNKRGQGYRSSGTSSSFKESESSSLPSTIRSFKSTSSNDSRSDHFIPHALSNTRRTNTPVATPKLIRARQPQH